MAKNVVTSAKTAARNALTAVVNAVKAKKGKPVTATPAGSKVTGVADTPTPRVKKAKKADDTGGTPPVSKKKKGQGKGAAAAASRDPKSVTRKIKGERLDSVSRVGADDVTRTRASWNGYSLSSLLKWVGKNGGDIGNAKALVATLGLTDATALSTICCQFYAGRQLSLGRKGNPLHSGAAADLGAADAKIVKQMSGMT